MWVLAPRWQLCSTGYKHPPAVSWSKQLAVLSSHWPTREAQNYQQPIRDVQSLVQYRNVMLIFHIFVYLLSILLMVYYWVWFANFFFKIFHFENYYIFFIFLFPSHQKVSKLAETIRLASAYPLIAKTTKLWFFYLL